MSMEEFQKLPCYDVRVRIYFAAVSGLKSNSSKDSIIRIPKVGMTLGFLVKWSTYIGLKWFHKQDYLS